MMRLTSHALVVALGLLAGACGAPPTPTLPAASDGPFELAPRSEADRLLLDATRLEPTDPAAAEALYAQVVELRPLDSFAWAGRARCALARGDHAEAGRLARRAIRYGRVINDVFAIQDSDSTLGLVLLGQGREAAAHDMLLSAMLSSDGSQMGCAYQGLGELYAVLGGAAPHALRSHAEAIAAFEAGDPGRATAALDRPPRAGEDPATHAALRALMLLLDRRYDEARELVAGLDGRAVAVVRGHLQVAAQEHEAAERELTAAVQGWDEPQSGADGFLRRMAWIGLGWASGNRGAWREASPWFERVLEERADDRLGLLGQANALAWLGDAEGSEALLQRVLEAHPDDPYALAELAGIQLDRGELQAAEASYRAALKTGGERYTCPWEGLGLVYLQQGRVAEAREHLEHAVAINPNIEYRKYNGLARIALAEGDVEEARRLLLRSIENYPADPEAAELLKQIDGGGAR
jgi:tetratricopeptide (TPR) repeat protein